MQQFVIDDSIKNDFVPEFLMAVEEAKARRGRVYSLWVEIKHSRHKETVGAYIFETTSKDVFLGLGAFGFTAPESLAGILELEFLKRGCQSLLCSIVEDGDSILIVRTQDPDDTGKDKTVTFTLSRAGR